jgi:hypothetical protein
MAAVPAPIHPGPHLGRPHNDNFVERRRRAREYREAEAYSTLAIDDSDCFLPRPLTCPLATVKYKREAGATVPAGLIG